MSGVRSERAPEDATSPASGQGHQIPGAAAAGHEAELDTAELAERRAAVRELGTRLRELTEAAIRTEADADVLRDTATQVAALVDGLETRQREPRTPPSVDDLRSGVRMYNPVIGTGHPLPPPVRYELDGTQVEGRCTLGLTHEGPPTSAHGGVSALLLDQLLGHATAAVGNIGVTTELKLRYRRPVPLGVPLRIWARAEEVDGQRTTTKGAIATVAEPDVPLVEARARFLSLTEQQTRRMLPELFSGATEERGGQG